MIEERYRGGACCDDLVAALGEDALAAGEAGALLAFEGDRADQRAVVQAGALCGEALAVELGEQRRFARCEGAAAGCEGENKGNRYQAHGGRVAGTRRAGERVNAASGTKFEGGEKRAQGVHTPCTGGMGFCGWEEGKGVGGGGGDGEIWCAVNALPTEAGIVARLG